MTVSCPPVIAASRMNRKFMAAGIGEPLVLAGLVNARLQRSSGLWHGDPPIAVVAWCRMRGGQRCGSRTAPMHAQAPWLASSGDRTDGADLGVS
jgi:hypothetical protein